jgi:hypothetical protein
MNKKLLIVSIAVLIFGIGLIVYGYFSGRENNEQVFCTTDALLCPNGSYVGRGGSKCEFAKCPTQSPIIGTLRQNAEGFDLIMGSPSNETTDVSYVMPITLKVSNVVGLLVGKKVQVFGYFTEGNKYYVDRLEEIKDSDPTLGEVGVGETVFINGVKITLNAVVQDNRCPVDAQCIEGGAINTNVTLQSSTDKETRNMPSDEVPISFDSYKISIEKITPPRLSNSEPNSLSYRITFRVRENI